jgi:repressor LexA
MNRIKMLREEKHLTQQELADKLNSAKSTIGMYENGNRKPSYEVLIKLSEIFGCSIDYIVGTSNERNSNVQYDPNAKVYSVPIVGKIRAGEPILAEDNIEGYFPILPSMYNADSTQDLFCLEVIGDSMNNVIEEGSYALIRKQDTAENGDIVVALVNGDNEATLKRFEQINNSLVALKPDSTNKDYSVRYIDLATTEFKIIGKIIGKFKSMN